MKGTHSTKHTVLVAVSMILAGVVSRFIPHLPNFTPIGAMALFGGAVLNRKHVAYLIPVVSLFISNLIFEVLRNGEGFNSQLLWVYGSMLLITRLGVLLQERDHRQSMVLASLTGSLLFFAITNFGVWAAGFYGSGLTALTNCYISGIPFFGNTILGDLFYNMLFFGGFALATRRLQKVKI